MYLYIVHIMPYSSFPVNLRGTYLITIHTTWKFKMNLTKVIKTIFNCFISELVCAHILVIDHFRVFLL